MDSGCMMSVPQASMNKEWKALLVMLCNASIATLAVLTAEWSADHTCNAEVVLVEFVRFEKLVYYGLLLISATRLGDIAWISGHGHEIKVGTGSDERCKGKIKKHVRCKSPCERLGYSSSARTY